MGDDPSLERNFKIWDPLYHTHQIKGMYHDEANRRLYLPRGIDVHYLERKFNTVATVIYEHDPMEKMSDVKIRYLPRDKVQKEAIKFMTGLAPYMSNSRKSQLSINLPTGKGKTYCSIATAVYLGLRSAVIAANLNWLEQWSDFIRQYTDIKSKDIYTIKGKESIDFLLRKKDLPYKFFLISQSTITLYGNRHGWDKVKELFCHIKIGIKFYDEAHLSFDGICMIDFFTDTYKTCYVTATPLRSDRKENNIYQLAFKNVPKIDLFDSETDPHTHYIAILYDSIPTPYQHKECVWRYGLNRLKYIDYLMSNERFYMALAIIVNLISTKTAKKTLIYIGTNKAIETVYKHLENEYPELRGQIGIYTSVTDPSIKDSQLNKRIILSTTKSCGAAMDIKDLDMTVLLAEPFKSEVLARQTLGRTRKYDTFYVELVDRSFRHTYDYYRYKRPIFEKYALSQSEIRFTPRDLQKRCFEIREERIASTFQDIIRIHQPKQEAFKDIIISHKGR
jgi:superfamily II DNA or RNA helicase